MNKLLFILCQTVNRTGGGIGKKILSQVDAFKSVGTEVSLSVLEVDQNNVYSGRSVDGELIEQFQSVFGRRVPWLWRLSFKKLYEYITDNHFAVVYVRYSHFANPFFNRFLKRLKQKGIIILLEIPTFPYDGEYVGAVLSLKIMKCIEGFYRNSFHKYVTRIVTFSNQDEIFRTKTIKIHNGIDLSAVQQKQETDNIDEVHLIAVAVINRWHGYDRIIEGLQRYYSGQASKKVILHIVGDTGNKESLYYKRLTENYGLEEFINFHGFKSGDELSNLFNKADMAIGPLGFHRVGVEYITPIKLAEYAARGLPFIYSGVNDLFDKQPFVVKTTPDESPIDISVLVDFCDKNVFTPWEIRKFAEDNLTWEIQMKRIVEEVNSIQNQGK